MRFVLLIFLAGALQAQTYDLVIRGGRVIDPESGLDAVRNVGIRAGKIAAVSSAALQGKEVIDARGLVVSPGFIDLHSHGQDPENYAYKARDGVTTALEMEVGVSPVPEWYAARKGKAVINFGATAGHIPARMALMHDTGTLVPRDKAVTNPASADDIGKNLAQLRQGLDQGALGIGIGIAYMPKTTREEILEIFRLAALKHAVVYAHIRNAGPVEPGFLDALQEVLADALVTGASLHIVHITSMAFRQTPLALEMIDAARAKGIDVTTECYPYTAGMTRLESAVFDPGWQKRLGISFGDLQWTATGERLTEETFGKYRKQGGDVVLHSIPEDMVRMALSHPGVIVASDGWLQQGKGHPRATGTYARVLGCYVREQKVLSLMEALRKMTLLPAVRANLQAKGRIKVGADADLTLFNADTVTDRSTYDSPALFSEGIPYVVVGGKLVVRDSKVVEGLSPGRAIVR